MHFAGCLICSLWKHKRDGNNDNRKFDLVACRGRAGLEVSCKGTCRGSRKCTQAKAVYIRLPVMIPTNRVHGAK